MRSERKLDFARCLKTFGRPIAFYPRLAAILGLKEALLICQLIYWTPRAHNRDGWIYKTAQEWEQETGLSYKEQLRARRSLRKQGILQERYERLKHRLYFRVDVEAFNRTLSEARAPSQREDREIQTCNAGDKKALPELPSGLVPSPQKEDSEPLQGQFVLGTETTANITTEITPTVPLREHRSEAARPLVSGGTKRPDYNEFMQIWNDHCGRLPRVRELTKKRIEKLKARINCKSTFREEFAEAVRKAAKTPFLLGENDRGWSADFDWMINDDTNSIRVLEGKYDAQIRNGRSRGGAYQSEDPNRTYDKTPDLVVVS